jgi:16S rRNA (adenine1518-N6/adenine1519-N6)-dimethyltransferase
MFVKAKKHLGQHFLKDENIAKKIAHTLTGQGYTNVLEIGPGMGVLTKYLLENKNVLTFVVEIDSESVTYLKQHYPNKIEKIISENFLKINLSDYFGDQPLAIIGNFPYNISSQILFKTLENKDRIPEFCGMFQKEVARRIAAKPGNKTYGILSVLTQAFYEVDYLFEVPPSVFTPPPKVDSAVLHLIRIKNFKLPVDEFSFFKLVKTAFNQRRKTLRNSLKAYNLSNKLREDAIFALRPEQLSVQDFIKLTKLVAEDAF